MLFRSEYERFIIEKEPTYSDVYESGTIVSQTPRAGSCRVFFGDRIEIKVRVSIGREELRMPDLCGYDCYEAACQLRELGVIVRFVYLYDDDMASDTVIKSSPAPTSAINKGDKITLFVSQERVEHPVRVRDLSGMSREEAVKVLMSDGLLLGRIVTLPSEKSCDGIVMGQSIPQGSLVKLGTKIDITVAEYSEASGFFNGDIIKDEIDENTEYGE